MNFGSVEDFSGKPGFMITPVADIVYGTPHMLVNALGYIPKIIYEVGADGKFVNLAYDKEKEVYVKAKTSEEHIEDLNRNI